MLRCADGEVRFPILWSLGMTEGRRVQAINAIHYRVLPH